MINETFYNGYAFRLRKAGNLYLVQIYQAGERIPVQNLVTQSLESAQEFYDRKLLGLIEASRPSGEK